MQEDTSENKFWPFLFIVFTDLHQRSMKMGLNILRVETCQKEYGRRYVWRHPHDYGNSVIDRKCLVLINDAC